MPAGDQVWLQCCRWLPAVVHCQRPWAGGGWSKVGKDTQRIPREYQENTGLGGGGGGREGKGRRRGGEGGGGVGGELKMEKEEGGEEK